MISLYAALSNRVIINILSNACGACYTQLPRQTIIEIKENISIISCPNCSIYLFFNEELD